MRFQYEASPILNARDFTFIPHTPTVIVMLGITGIIAAPDFT